MERVFEISPAKEPPNAKCSAILRMAVKGEAGAVEFLVGTGWFYPNLDSGYPYYEEVPPEKRTEFVKGMLHRAEGPCSSAEHVGIGGRG